MKYYVIYSHHTPLSGRISEVKRFYTRGGRNFFIEQLWWSKNFTIEGFGQGELWKD